MEQTVTALLKTYCENYFIKLPKTRVAGEESWDDGVREYDVKIFFADGLITLQAATNNRLAVLFWNTVKVAPSDKVESITTTVFDYENVKELLDIVKSFFEKNPNSSTKTKAFEPVLTEFLEKQEVYPDNDPQHMPIYKGIFLNKG